MQEHPAQSGPRRLVLVSAWVLTSLGVVSAVAGLFWANRAGYAISLPWPVVLSGSLVGLAIVSRKPRNLFGWEILIVSVVVNLTVGMEGYWYYFGVSDPTPSALAVWLWWMVQVVPTSTFVFFAVGLPLLFPTGKPPSSRWHWVGWLAVVAAVLGTAAWASAPNLCALPLDTDVVPLSPSSDCAPPIPSPWVWFTGTTADFVSAVWQPLLAISAVVAVVSMIARYRAGDAKERIQMKLYLVAIIASLVLLTTAEVLGLPDWIGNIGYLFIPVALAVAILRHQLFDIDRLISRTVSYTLVVGVLGVAFFALMSLPGMIIGGTSATGALASAPPILVAASTLAVAALFNPLRKRTQTWVDRRFNRTRYVAETELEAFANMLRVETDLGTVESALMAVVVRTLQPSSIGFWSIDSDRT